MGRSLAYRGFKKIIFLNGHGSNTPNLDLAARRVNLETDAECIACNWWPLLTVDPEFMKTWRASKFPGGCAHACELETSVYLIAGGAEKLVVEIGGKGKGRQQFKGIDIDRKLIFADTDAPANGRIPLFMIGYLA